MSAQVVVKTMTRLFDILIALITLTGCTAAYAVPVSMPVWGVIGILFLFRVGWRQAWLNATIFCLLQLIAISVWGIAAWLIDGYSTTGDSLFWTSIGASIILTLTLLLSRHHLSTQATRAWVVLLQLVVAVAMIGVTVSTIFLQ